MANNEGTPLHGDRSAWNTTEHDDEHARDINEAALQRHLPAPAADGNYARDDGTDWQAQSGIPLADLLDYARGAIIRGGAAAWEALGLGAADKVLKSDGTDVTWDNVGHDELTDVTDNDHHNPATLDADADTLLELTVQELGLDTQTANTLLAGPDGGAAAVPTFRALASDDLPSINLDDLADVEAASPDDDDVLTWDSAASDWVPSESTGGGAAPIFSQIVDVEVVNTTTETTLLGAGRGSKTISADTLDVGTTIRLTLAGHLSDTGAPNITIDVDLGGIQIATTGAQALNNTVTESDWHLTFDIVCRTTGATGTVVGSGLFEHDDDAQFGLVNTSAVTVDTTGDLAVAVTVTWGTADALNTITCQEATIELLQADTLAVAAPSGLTATEV